MKQVTTYVGLDAQKQGPLQRDAMGTQAVPVTWTVSNEPNAVRRLVRTHERKVGRLLRIIAARMALQAGTRLGPYQSCPSSGLGDGMGVGPTLVEKPASPLRSRGVASQ